MEEFKDQYVDVNGYKTRYWSYGNASSIILLLHGFAFSVELWELNIPDLSKNHKVIAIDLLGFGLTDKPKGKQNLDTYPQFVYSFMQKMSILKAHVVGHSMGGLIATKLAQMHPECIETLVLLCSPGFQTYIPLHFRIFSLPFIGELFIKPNKKGLEGALRKNTFNKSTVSKKLVERLYEFSLHPEMGKTLLKVTRTSINIFGFKKFIINSIKNGIDKLTMPVLIIWGKEDEIIYSNQAYAANKIIKHSKLVIFENCGHLPQLEYPEKFNQLLEDFLIHKPK
jgi:2-hydroxy-6-oxonona-2,4-dienedioate hydrolase